MGRICAAVAFGVMILGLWIGGVSVGPSSHAHSGAAPSPSSILATPAAHETTVPALAATPGTHGGTVPATGATPAAGPRSARLPGRDDAGTRAAQAPGLGSYYPAGRAPGFGEPVPIDANATPAPSPQAFPWMHCDAHPNVAPVDPRGVTVLIPRLGIRAPVYDRGVDDLGNMIIAPGYALTHLTYTARLGTWDNYVVYGHDDIQQCIFRDLGSLRVGDTVEFYRGTTRYTYVVTARDLVDPSDVRVLDHTDEPIATLISCYPVGVDSQRIVVISNLVAIDDNVPLPD